MLKRVIIRNGKKYIVNVPTWDEAMTWGDQVGTGSQPYILPFISTQPLNASGSIGATVSFFVDGGPAGPFDGLTYQWTSGSTSLVDNGHFTGSNAPTLIIYNLISSNSGSYYVSLATVNGSITSSHVSLTV